MEKKKETNILLIIMGLLIVLMGVAVACTVSGFWLPAICVLVALVFVALYGFWLYKKPHGNMLKYAMLLTAVANIITDAYLISTNCGSLVVHIISLLAAAAVCYGAGRLNRIEQNKYIFVITDIVFLIVAVIWTIQTSPEFPFLIFVKLYVYFVTFTTLIIAYFVRYKAHKEAGITDTPKTK